MRETDNGVRRLTSGDAIPYFILEAFLSHSCETVCVVLEIFTVKKIGKTLAVV